MRQELPDLDKDFLNGNVQRATNWLGDNLQRYGGLRDPELTISHATN